MAAVEGLLRPHSPRQGRSAVSIISQVHGCGSRCRHALSVTLEKLQGRYHLSVSALKPIVAASTQGVPHAVAQVSLCNGSEVEGRDALRSRLRHCSTSVLAAHTIIAP